MLSDCPQSARPKSWRAISLYKFSRKLHGRREGATMPNISPRLQKGAILTFDSTTGIPISKIMLQYNPETLSRSLKPQSVGEEPDRSEILRLKGPPVETL